ncbi:MAG: PTS fructose transporter subunit IIA [Gammaproteobacteria bacterium]|jgi:PTS system ascorbate-specific IIA component|nr:PTS fructose transporter subunit IIA [Gammaproteobacteria bacterium]
MSVGLCLVTHDRIGESMLATARSMLGACPLPAATVAVTSACDSSRAEGILREAREVVRRLDEGDGVIVLTDMYGSTPANIAAALGDLQGHDVAVIAGVNLPMLVRLLNYPGLSLGQLVEKALSGGREGIFLGTGEA